MFSLGNVRGEAGQCRPGSATCGATFCTSSPPASEIVAGAQYRRCRLGRIAATDHLQGHLLWAYLLAGTAHARLEQDLQRLRRQAEGAAAEHAWLELLDCGSMHDRDKNAAWNILAAGIQVTSTVGRVGA